MRLLLFILTSFVLTALSSAQLSGCDAVSCPTNANGRSQCVLGNSTAAALGIISFNSSLLPKPLTWTLSVQNLNSQQDLYERDFFLGAPRSLDLSGNKTDYTTFQQPQACSLFFDGIAPQLKFRGIDPQHDQGTCVDALSARCVADLQDQAKFELSKIFNSSSNDTIKNSTSPIPSICDTLSVSLRDTAPSSCNLASGSHWGSVLSRSLTGPASAQPVQEGTCHPTTGGKDYDISLIAANKVKALSRNTTDIEDVLYGITPIMTVVYGEENDTEVNMSCLKAIEPKGSGDNSTSYQSSDTVRSAEVGKAAVIIKAGMAFASILVLQGVFFSY